MSGVTKSVHMMYPESVVLRVPDNDINIEGLEHWKNIARKHFFADFQKLPTLTEVIKEEDAIYIVARCGAAKTKGV